MTTTSMRSSIEAMVLALICLVSPPMWCAQSNESASVYEDEFACLARVAESRGGKGLVCLSVLGKEDAEIIGVAFPTESRALVDYLDQFGDALSEVKGGFLTNQPTNTLFELDANSSDILNEMRKRVAVRQRQSSLGGRMTSSTWVLSLLSESLGVPIVDGLKFKPAVWIATFEPMQPAEAVTLLEVLCRLANWRIRRSGDGVNGLLVTDEKECWDRIVSGQSQVTVGGRTVPGRQGPRVQWWKSVRGKH